MTDRPFAPACERNKEPILSVLREHFADRKHVLEIGSGTGQHAVHFAAHLPHLVWQTSDRAENLPGVVSWLSHARLPNTPPPLQLDVTGDWPSRRFDAVFSANTLHIMSWPEVETFFARLADVLAPDAVLAIYGPFRYGGRHTSDSNAAFEASLKAAVPHRAIRDFEAVDALAQDLDLKLVQDHAMPANNRCLVWRTVK
mgnify:CR=1 FL=1|tara:strand:+ start:2394 stop:2990 length:597 start_codon:yes stop_codon:yes gene_type:complete